MTLSDFAIRQLVPYVTGDAYPPRRSVPQLVRLFNKFGAQDLFDYKRGGLPETGERNGRRASRREYAEARLKDFSSRPQLRDLLNQVINDLQTGVNTIDELNAILNPEQFSIVQKGSIFILQGGGHEKHEPLESVEHF